MKCVCGEITKLTTATTKQKIASLRTVVPMNIVRQWQLKKGDHLDWSWEVINGRMVLVVNKAMTNENNKNKKAVPHKQTKGE